MKAKLLQIFQNTPSAPTHHTKMHRIMFSKWKADKGLKRTGKNGGG